MRKAKVDAAVFPCCQHCRGGNGKPCDRWHLAGCPWPACSGVPSAGYPQ